MRREFSFLFGTLSVLAACSSFAGDPGPSGTNSDAGPDASTPAALDSGTETGADVDANVDADRPPSKQSCEGTEFCEDFENEIDAERWTTNVSLECVFQPSAAEKKVGNQAGYARVQPLGSNYNARVQHKLGPQATAGRIEAWVFVVGGGPAAAVQWDLMQIAVANRLLRVVVTSAGLKLAVNETGAQTPSATSPTLSFAFNQWIEVGVEYDLLKNVFNATIGGKSAEAAYDFALETANGVNGDLLLGLQVSGTEGMVEAYYDLLRIYAR